ncbi:hypothetical protein EWM64_g9431 [Hericium alpestre]|uniref:F-box domain-containing protein n=1 Tax=Hericium alpestre TaxID=135208 RepID=A0A4Y9ZL84_9AGAM|nr:hypothetical protein EWM64_g9431 [Hericium alpestre]
MESSDHTESTIRLQGHHECAPRSYASVDLYSPEDRIKEAIGRYDDVLKSLAESSAFVATPRNALIQNARIPPEILSRIFRFAVDLHPCTHDGPLPHERLPLNDMLEVVKTTRTLPGWLAITQVCRRWRDVAFRDPSLWTEVTYATSMTWLKENLARAQSLNLPVTLHRYIPRGYPPWENNEAELDLIDEHMSHIRELVVLMHPASMIYAVPLINAAPLLESLTLSRYGLGIDETDDELVQRLSDDIFAGHVPALRRLAVRGHIFRWTTSPLISASITHFELSLPECAYVQDDIYPDGLEEPSRAKLFLCLRRMPMLEALKLENCWPFEGHPWLDMIIEFARLQSLALIGTMASCVEFLQRVRIPSSASLNMSLRIDRRETADDDGALINILAERINVLSAGRCVSVAAFRLSENGSTDGYAAGLKLWRSQTGERFAEEEWQLFAINFDTGPSVLPVLRLLTSKLHLPELQVLSFFCRPSQTGAGTEAMGDIMVELLAQFAGTQHLIVNMRSVAVLGRAISTANSESSSEMGPGDDTGIPRLFRELTALSLLDTKRCFGDLKAHETLQSYPETELFEELDDWTPLFEGVVRVQALPAAMERYMDMEVVVQRPVTHDKILGYESEVLSD